MYDAEKQDVQDSGGFCLSTAAEEEIDGGEETRSAEERVFSTTGSGNSVLRTASKRSLRLDLRFDTFFLFQGFTFFSVNSCLGFAFLDQVLLSVQRDDFVCVSKLEFAKMKLPSVFEFDFVGFCCCRSYLFFPYRRLKDRL